MLKHIIVLLLLSCSSFSKIKQPDYVGHWRGTVLVVIVHYEIEKENYEQRTYSSNMVQVGGTKGTYYVKNNRFVFNQIAEYRFNNLTLSGEWYPLRKTFDYSFVMPELNNLVFEYQDEVPIVLEKQ